MGSYPRIIRPRAATKRRVDVGRCPSCVRPKCPGCSARAKPRPRTELRLTLTRAALTSYGANGSWGPTLSARREAPSMVDGGRTPARRGAPVFPRAPSGVVVLLGEARPHRRVLVRCPVLLFYRQDPRLIGGIRVLRGRDRNDVWHVPRSGMPSEPASGTTSRWSASHANRSVRTTRCRRSSRVPGRARQSPRSSSSPSCPA